MHLKLYCHFFIKRIEDRCSLIIIIVLGRITFGHIEVADKVFVVIIIIGFYFIKKVICPVRGIHLLVCKIKVVVVGKSSCESFHVTST